MPASVGGDVATLDPVRQRLVREELARILSSTTFSESKRAVQFLQFVVDETLAGHSRSEMKERLIGIRLFGLPPDFDPSEHSIVRVTANEVRKKLAQYYFEPDRGTSIRIELPAGSYFAHFRWGQEPLATPTVHAFSLRCYWVVGTVVLTVFLGLLALSLALRAKGSGTAVQKFWEPALRSSKPILVVLPSPYGYRPTHQGIMEYLRSLPPDQRLRPFVVPPEQAVKAGLVTITDQFTGVGDAYALSAYAAHFAGLGKSFQVRIGNDVAFPELRNSPAVLVGAYSNHWTHEMTNGLRFVFDMEDLVFVVRDRNSGLAWRADEGPWADMKVKEDYAIISRIIDSKTGGFLICAGGLTNYGTRAAADFLTQESYLERAMAGVPANWERKNVQILIRTQVIDRTPCPPVMVARHIW